MVSDGGEKSFVLHVLYINYEHFVVIATKRLFLISRKWIDITNLTQVEVNSTARIVCSLVFSFFRP